MRSTMLATLLLSACARAAPTPAPLAAVDTPSEPAPVSEATATEAPRSCEGRMAEVSTRVNSLPRGWRVLCDISGPAFDLSLGDVIQRNRLSWDEWDAVWAGLDAIAWNDLYDGCDEPQLAADAQAPRFDFELRDGERQREFSCRGSRLPDPFPAIARLLRSAARYDFSPRIESAGTSAPHPSSMSPPSSDDCDGVTLRWEFSAESRYSEIVIQCFGARAVTWERHGGLGGKGKRSARVRVKPEAWAQLWSTLVALEWWALPSSCPRLRPDDEGRYMGKLETLTITDQHGSRELRCANRNALPSPYAEVLVAIEQARALQGL